MARKKKQLSTRALFGIFVVLAFLILITVYYINGGPSADTSRSTYTGTVLAPAQDQPNAWKDFYRLQVEGTTTDNVFVLLPYAQGGYNSNIGREIIDNVDKRVTIQRVLDIERKGDYRGIHVWRLSKAT